MHKKPNTEEVSQLGRPTNGSELSGSVDRPNGAHTVKELVRQIVESKSLTYEVRQQIISIVLNSIPDSARNESAWDLPTPSILRELEEIVPGLAKDIAEQAKEERRGEMRDVRRRNLNSEIRAYWGAIVPPSLILAALYFLRDFLTSIMWPIAIIVGVVVVAFVIAIWRFTQMDRHKAEKQVEISRIDQNARIETMKILRDIVAAIANNPPKKP